MVQSEHNQTPRKDTQKVSELAQEVLNKYLSLYPQERENLQSLLSQITTGSDLSSRKNFEGHITASAYVVNPKNDKILLIWHNGLQKWLQPGGHYEQEDEFTHTAQREVLEETGLSVELHPWHRASNAPIDIDTHPIPANVKKQEKSHQHHDFRYVFISSTEEVELDTQEVARYKWFLFDEVSSVIPDLPMQKIKAVIESSNE